MRHPDPLAEANHAVNVAVRQCIEADADLIAAGLELTAARQAYVDTLAALAEDRRRTRRHPLRRVWSWLADHLIPSSALSGWH